MRRDTNEPALHRQERDFRACPEEERDTCLSYEYARKFVRGRPDLAACWLNTLARSPMAIRSCLS